MQLREAIDKAAEKCGGQNALALRLQEDKSNVSAWKRGAKPIPTAKVRAIAELIEVDPGDLWLIAQEARNPLRGQKAAVLGGLIFAVLSLIPSANTEAKSTRYEGQSLMDRSNIVRRRRWGFRGLGLALKSRYAGA